MKETTGISYFIELFFAAQLNLITASQKLFDTLTKMQRHALVVACRDTELAQWKAARRGPRLVRGGKFDFPDVPGFSFPDASV